MVENLHYIINNFATEITNGYKKIVLLGSNSNKQKINALRFF